MNKKTKTKILTLSAVSALSLAAIWVLASNPNDLLNFEWEVKQDAHLELSRLSLTTDPTTPQATSKSDVSWTVNDGKLITHTGTNAPTNQISANGTLSFWGSNNKTRDPESLILGGSSNEITNTAKANIIAASQWVKTAGEGTTNHGTGNVILASSGVNLTGNGNILRAGNNTKIHGNDNLTFATDKVKISANNSIAIGGNITINDNGSFVFNGAPDPVTTRKPNTAIINTSNGMIINTETKTATNTDLTISGSLQVGRDSQIDEAGAIISDRCIKLKGIFNGEIGLECREHTNFWGETSLPKTPKCGRNATKYTIHDSNWRSTNKADFCSEGALEISPENKRFRTLLERTTATGKGMYATKGFTYDFTICFWDRDPLCAPKTLRKTWRCKTQEGNAIRCEANLQIKKMECDANHHFEDVNQTNWSTKGGQWQCLPNTKSVACDNSQRLDTTNGLFPNATVKVERNKSKRNYTAPEPCVLKCDDGYHLADNNTRCESNTREVSCENKNHVVDTEWGRIANARYEETRDSENWRPKTTKEVCRLSCNEGGALNTAKTACELSHEIKRCNLTFSSWTWLNYIISYHKYYRDPSLKKIPDAKLCDFSCNPWYNKASKKRKCVQCDASKNRDASSESCVDKTKYTCENIPENSHQVGSPNYQQNVSAKLVDESSNNTEPCTYKCNPGYRKQWDQCQKVCNSDQHLENGNCVSNTKTVNCDDTGINKENGTINRKKVTASWVDEKWITPKCELTCNTGYRKDDSSSHNIHCANKEENNFRCIWDIPKFSSLISKDDEGLTKNTTISLVERWRNTTSKCEYQCDKWYFKVGNRCEKPCYATMVRDGLSEKHYRNYKPFTYYIPHSFIAWRLYNPYDLAKIQSNFFKIIDLSKFPIEWIDASPYYKVPNRLTPDYEWYEEWTGFEYSDRDYTKNTALFIKDWQCKNDRWWNEKCDYLYVRPYESVIKQDSDLGKVYSTHHYTYVSVAQAESGFYTSPGWYHNNRRFQNLWSSALCYFDQESNSCSTSVGYTWWPHTPNSLYYCSDISPKLEYGNCWGTMTYDGKPCSEMKTKESCNKNEKSPNSYAYCKWYGK